MSRLRWLRLPWRFNRAIGVSLLWMGGSIGVAVLVSIAGVHFVGGIDVWTEWLRHHAVHFLIWRLGLYALTAYGWWWMRRRLRQRDGSEETRHRLLRVEVAALTTVVLLEGSQLLLHR